MLSRFTYLVLSCFFAYGAVAQRKKSADASPPFEFHKLFLESSKLKTLEPQTVEHWRGMVCGLFNNRPYLKEKGWLELEGRSIYQQEMDQAIIPIWQDKWTDNAWWGYMIRYFHGKPNQPITQIILHLERQADGELTMTAYAIRPDKMSGLVAKWWTEDPLPNLSPKDFSPEVCVMQGRFTEDGAYVFETQAPCDAGTALNFKSYDFYSKAGFDYWDLGMTFYDAQGQVLYKDQEPIRFTRLSNKEISKRISNYQTGSSSQK